MLRDEELHHLLPEIYEAAVEPELWPEVLEQLSSALEARAGALAVHDFRLQTGTLYKTFGYQPDLLEQYADRHAAQNLWFRHEHFYRQPGAIVAGHEVVREDELIRTGFYREWLRPQDLHHHLCGVLRRTDSVIVCLTVMRSSSAAPFGAHERNRMALVIPHLQRALQLHRRVAVLRRDRDIAQQALDRLPTGILFVDGKSRLISRNRRADEMLATGDLLLRDGRIRAADDDASSRLRQLIADCQATASGAGTEPGGAFQIARGAGQRPLQVLVTPMRSMCELLGHERALAAVFVGDPDRPVEAENERLCQLYGLTRVEAELAMRIAQGQSVDEASKSLRIALNTGRAYLKRIFVKTGVHRQPDLVRLVLIGPAWFRSA